MATPDKSFDTIDRMRIYPYDPAMSGLPIPDSAPDETLLYSVCVNAKWFALIIGMVERLAWRDAWDTDDEQLAQDAVNNAVKLLDMLAKRSICMPNIVIPTTCDCTIINLSEEVNNFWRYDIESVNQYEINETNFEFNLLSNNSLALQEQTVLEASEGDLPMPRHICQAATMLFYWFVDIGVAGKQGKIDHTSPVPFVDKVSEWATFAFTLGNLLSKIFPQTQAMQATTGAAASIAFVADDISHLAAVILLTDFSENEINDFVCRLYEAMLPANAGYTQFQNVDFLNQDMNDIWSGIMSPELYGTWLALVGDPTIEAEFHCCTDCVDTFAGWQEVRSGLRHHVDNKMIMLPPQAHSGGNISRKITIRVHYDAPGILRSVVFNTSGKTFYSPYLGSVNLVIRTDVHGGSAQCISWTTGLPAERADMESHDLFLAPSSIVGGAQPQSTWFEIEAEYARCSACNAQALTNFDNAWGYMVDIRYCLE